MKSLRSLLLHVLCFLVVVKTCCSSSSSDRNPYQVLGLKSDATQAEIRSSYRRLCLKYHPDKNGGISAKEQERRTEIFKEIQAANSLIGDPESRRSYDLQSSFFAPRQRGTYATAAGSRSRPSSSYEFNPSYQFPRHSFQDDVDSFYRSFASRRSSSQTTTNPMFGFTFGNRNIRISRTPLFGTSLWSNNGGSLKSTFVQKVKVPLQDLYKGRTNMEFQVQDSLWKSYSAAFRGGFGYLIIYQSIIFAAPLLRLSRWATLIIGALVFHSHIPRPQAGVPYTADIRPGYKEGTKIKFVNAEPGFDLVFQVEEETHERFVREGNNLHTTVTILASQAKEGCTIEVESLNPMEEPPVRIRLRPKQIKHSGDVVTVKDKGWPSRKEGKRGDLVVQFRIVRKLSKSKSKRGGKRRKKRRSKKKNS